MTKNRFLSKRLACLLTTALIAAPIFLINNKPANATATAIADGVTLAVLATDAVITMAASATIGTGTAGLTGATLTSTAGGTLTLTGAGGLTLSGALTVATATTLVTAIGASQLTLQGALVETGTGVASVTMTSGGILNVNKSTGTQAIAGIINGAGTVAVGGTGVKTFSEAIGGVTPVTNVTVATGSSGTFVAAVTTANMTNSGAAIFSQLNLSGTGEINAKTNATTGITQSGTSDLTVNFATTVADATTNVVGIHTGAANTTLTIGKAVTNGMVVFKTTDQTTAAILGKIYMPANLVDGQTLTLHSNVATGDIDTAITATNVALQDNALTNYTAAKSTLINVVTSTDKSAATTATELGVNTNKATGLLQARNAAAAGVTADGAAVDAIFNVLNGRSGQSATADTAFTNQVAPQTDTITGSTVAAKAVTSGVQNVISTRLASLRSGDAYSTGVVTGSGMSANSGFVQAFGSKVEQKNKGNEFGYDADTTGFAVGFDGKIDGGAVIGISYAHSQADVDGKGTAKAKNDIKTDSVSLYADYATKDGYVEGSITYGRSDNKGSRVIDTGGLSRTYASNYDSEQYSLRLSGGIPQSLGGGAFFTPFAAATISQIKADAYTETSTTANDSLRLRVAQDTVDSQVGTVGVKFHQTIKDGKTTFTPEVKLAVNQEFGDDTITTTNTYQGGGASFKNSTAIEKTSATAGVGLNISSDNVSFNIGYEADVRDKYLGHSAQAKITAKF
jgi:outer membrane autotransporter protein